MKIYTTVKIDMDTGETIAEDSFEYEGPLALAVDGSYTAGYEPSSSSYTAGYEPSSSSTESNKSNNDDTEDSGSSEFNGSFRGNYDLGANKYISSFNNIGEKVDRSMSKYFGSSGSSSSSNPSLWNTDLSDQDWGTLTVGFTVNFSSWIVKSVDYVHQKLFGESLFEPDAQVQGFSAGIAFSSPWNSALAWNSKVEWDIGVYGSLLVGGIGKGKSGALGYLSLDLGTNEGSVVDLANLENIDIGGHYGPAGLTFSFDGNDYNFTGTSLNLGIGVYGGIAAAPTGVWSVRHGGVARHGGE